MLRHHLDEQKKALQLTFEVDLLGSNVEEIASRINDILEDKKDDNLDVLILDILKANRVDSMGFNLLISLIKRAKLYNWRVKSRISSPSIYRACCLTNLTRHMEIELVEKD